MIGFKIQVPRGLTYLDLGGTHTSHIQAALCTGWTVRKHNPGSSEQSQNQSLQPMGIIKLILRTIELMCLPE